MNVSIQNIVDLRLEIARLKAIKVEQEIVIKAHFKSPSAIFRTVKEIFSGSGNKNAKGGSFDVNELITMASRVVIPFVLNTTIFRKSNFIVKALVSLISQRASGLVNEKSIISVWDKAKGITSKLKGLIPEKWGNKKEEYIEIATPVRASKISEQVTMPPPM